MKLDTISRNNWSEITITVSEEEKTKTIIFGDIISFLDYIGIYEHNTTFVRQIAANILKTIKSWNTLSIVDEELLFMMWYCYYKIGDFKRACIYFNKIPDNWKNNYLLDQLTNMYKHMWHERALILEKRVSQVREEISKAAFRAVFWDIDWSTYKTEWNRLS